MALTEIKKLLRMFYVLVWTFVCNYKWRVIAIIVVILFYVFTFTEDKKHGDRVNFANFPTRLIHNKGTRIVEINVFENTNNATITPAQIVIKPGYVLIGVIEGNMHIREVSGAFRPTSPLNFLNFTFKNRGTIQPSTLTEVITNDDVLNISFKKGLSREKIYTSIIENGKYRPHKIKIGIHYSPIALQLGMAPKSFISTNPSLSAKIIASIPKNAGVFQTTVDNFLNGEQRFKNTVLKIKNSVDPKVLKIPFSGIDRVEEKLSVTKKQQSAKAKSWIEKRVLDLSVGYRPKSKKNHIESSKGEESTSLKSEYFDQNGSLLLPRPLEM